jgi:acyl carrier protein
MNPVQEVRATVEAEVQRVLQNSGRPVRSFQDEELLFAQIGLDSLDVAQVVVAIEQSLGIDPFRKPGSPIRTFGDLVHAYLSEQESK